MTMYDVEVCRKCGALVSVTKTDNLALCSFDSENTLSFAEVLGALREGKISASSYAICCEFCHTQEEFTEDLEMC